MNFFGTKPVPKVDPVDQGKLWKRNIEKEARKIDRDIENIRRQEKLALKECKKYAEKGQLGAARILAKEIGQTRKTVDRMYLMKAQLNSAAMTIQHSIAMTKVTGCISQSTEVMSAMNSLLRTKGVSETMRELGIEMQKAGIISDLIEDTFDSMEPENTDELADIEVNKILEEITSTMMNQAGSIPTNKLGTTATATAANQESTEGVIPDADSDIQAMQDRFHAL